jgi:hypothetical protein
MLAALVRVMKMKSVGKEIVVEVEMIRTLSHHRIITKKCRPGL